MKDDLLLKLADMLDADADNPRGLTFNMKHFGYVVDGPEAALSCGTVACALGLAAISGEFPGLNFRVPPDRMNGTVWFTYANGSKVWGFKAAQGVFDLSHEEAHWLFGPGNYILSQQSGAKGEHYVANRIRELVRDGGVAPGIDVYLC